MFARWVAKLPSKKNPNESFAWILFWGCHAHECREKAIPNGKVIVLFEMGDEGK